MAMYVTHEDLIKMAGALNELENLTYDIDSVKVGQHKLLLERQRDKTYKIRGITTGEFTGHSGTFRKPSESPF